MKNKKILIWLILPIFVSCFTCVFSDGNNYTEQNLYYDFTKAEPFSYLSTEYTSYAIASDGTLLQRIIFKNIISDSIVKFFNGKITLIPIENKIIQENFYQFSDYLKFFLNSNFISKLIKNIFIYTGAILIFLTILSNDLIKIKINELLAVLSRSREGRIYILSNY